MLGGKHMAISYNNLWKLLIDKNMNKSELRSITGISSSTMAKITNQEKVALQVLEKICAELDCNIEDVMQFTYLEEIKKKMHA
jgi:DNA-binding Xre family transcriptional regulator